MGPKAPSPQAVGAVLTGVGAAFVASFPAFILAATVALPLSTRKDLGSIANILLFGMAILASLLALPGAFLGTSNRCRCACYVWGAIPGISAALSSGVPLLCMIAISESPFQPITLTMLLGFAITGFVSGLASQMVSARSR